MLKNPKKLSKSLSAQYYNIAQQSTFMYVYTYVRMYVCMYVPIYVSFLMINSDVFVSALKIDGYNKNKC